MMETCTVDTPHLLELAAEIQGLRAQLQNYCARSTYRERRLLELVAALARRLEPPREDGPVIDAPPGSLAELRAKAVRQALIHAQGNKYHAARALGVNVKTVYNLMREAGLPLSYGQAKVPALKG